MSLRTEPVVPRDWARQQKQLRFHPDAPTIRFSDAWTETVADLIANKRWDGGRAAHTASSRRLWIGLIGDTPLESEVLKDLVRTSMLDDTDRFILVKELKRPDQFLGVVRTDATPEGNGLNQLLPVANIVSGIATFETLHNPVTSADSIETLILAIKH